MIIWYNLDVPNLSYLAYKFFMPGISGFRQICHLYSNLCQIIIKVGPSSWGEIMSLINSAILGIFYFVLLQPFQCWCQNDKGFHSLPYLTSLGAILENNKIAKHICVTHCVLGIYQKCREKLAIWPNLELKWNIFDQIIYLKKNVQFNFIAFFDIHVENFHSV